MEKNFKNCLFIGINKNSDSNIVINISSDYSRSARKEQLHINEEKFGDEVLGLWKSIATKKLLSINVSFSEIDYYDSMTDIYEVPSFYIERGMRMRKAQIIQKEHGSIPKDWEINVTLIIEGTKTITPITEVLKETLGDLLDVKHEAELLKLIRPFLEGTVNNINYEIETLVKQKY